MAKTTNASQKGPQTLYQHGALGPGSKLWIVPCLEESPWTKQLDWHLNFQISKAHQYKKEAMSETLTELIKQVELEDIKASDEAGPLLIASQGKLPNEMTVELSKSNNPKEWLKKAHEIWVQLKKPSVRIFLPNQLETVEFNKLWPDLRGEDITIVSG